MTAAARLALVLAVSVFTSFAFGQQYPGKPVHVVVGFSPGGGTDLLARLVAQKLTEYWGNTVIVENRAGASGLIGADYVAKAPPDGYTILVGSINQNAIAPAIFAKLPFNASSDFESIVNLGYSALVLIVHPSLPVRSVKEVISLAKRHPGELTAATPGIGTTHHLALEMFMLATGTKIINVPFKGSGESSVALIGGHVLMAFDVLPPNMAHIKAGRLRPLAVTTSKRSTRMPEIPTMQEEGAKGFEIINWWGFFAPAKTSREIVNKVNAGINRALQDPSVAKRIDDAGIEIGGGTPGQFDAYVKSEIAKISKLVKAAGIKAESF